MVPRDTLQIKWVYRFKLMDESLKLTHFVVNRIVTVLFELKEELIE